MKKIWNKPLHKRKLVGILHYSTNENYYFAENVFFRKLHQLILEVIRQRFVISITLSYRINWTIAVFPIF